MPDTAEFIVQFAGGQPHSSTLGPEITKPMITKELAPVEWVMLMYELDDAREHIESLMEKMDSDPEFDESEFRVHLGHIFSHLNRAWNGRNRLGDLDGQAWHDASKFPSDLEPI